MKLTSFFAVAGLTLSLAACGGADAAPRAGGTSQEKAPASAAATGNVIEVEMRSGPGGEIFAPADFTARQGDVVRFKLVSGVHNANFATANNAAGLNLPPASPYLQAPGQTFEFVVEQRAGEYHYQCDPHAALGMVGTMTVVD